MNDACMQDSCLPQFVSWIASGLYRVREAIATLPASLIFTLEYHSSVKRCRDRVLYVHLLHLYLISTLYAHFLMCHPYISLHF